MRNRWGGGWVMKEAMIADDIGAVTCPRCGNYMIEFMQGEMTDGQESDDIAGFNHSYQCPECDYYGLFNVEPREIFEDEEVEELVKIIRVDPDSFEAVIEHALKSHCFIEAISLIHNVIEAYLKKKIEDLTNNDRERLELLKKKFSPRYLRDYTTISYLLGIVDNQTYKLILEFNEKRNKVIHELMTNPKDIEQIRQIARRGREMQMKLSPLNHSPQDISNIMAEFDRITQ